MENQIKKMLSIHLTDLCNNKCRFCIVDSPAQRANSIKQEKIFFFLEEHRDQGYGAVNLHGGESTTRKDFFEILAKIKECKYPEIILQTNARKLSKMEYAQKAADLGITKLVVSIHGGKSVTHDHITMVPGSLKQAVKGIKNAKTLGLHVRTNTVMSKMNTNEFVDIMKLLLRLNVDHVNISAIHTAGAAQKNFLEVVPHYRDIYSQLQQSVQLIVDAGITLTLEGFPFCMISGMEKYIINWESQKFKMLFREHVLDDYEAYMDDTMRVYGPPCESGCPERTRCGGVYKEYIDELGWNEFGYDNKPLH